MSDSASSKSEEHSCKRLRTDEGHGADVVIVAKRSGGGAVTNSLELRLPVSATIGDLASRLCSHESCQDAARITLIHRGAVLSKSSDMISSLAESSPDGKVNIVYLVRKPPAAAAAASGGASSSTSSSSAPPKASASTAPADTTKGATKASGHRVVLLLRHGQCVHDDGGKDEMKALSSHGHGQADASAKYIAALFAAGRLPAQRALVHSTSRRARETAAKLPQQLPGIQVWNNDLLRETDPTKNPFRAEEVFNRLFEAPPDSSSDTLIIVAHNNMNLYLLMRAAGVPIERASQAWRLFHLRHASITRIDINSCGEKRVVCVGAAAHIPHSLVTWNNIGGADMTAWKGGAPDRHKFSGRMLVLVRTVATENGAASSSAEVANHVKGLTEYMISAKHLTIACTPAAEHTATVVAKKFSDASVTVFPGSIAEEPEAAFLQYASSSSATARGSREAVVIIAEAFPLLYVLLRALQMSPEEARISSFSYQIGFGSVTLVNLKSDGSTKVVGIGDIGHLPMSGDKRAAS
eukprot:TRINITY_DN49010_c0_g1_i1.p1 TRINITY_DN49010_c0_g1~~TRINITY_DN49010_c0_g1_i1.p1  ORF type:complete len:524 (+),score=82.17 TRINITY_DN49010_c0_g1_i1:115-1686(+)